MGAWTWGVPDWRDAAAYEVNRSPRQWRWEFLRRRQDYREDWLKHYEPGRREALAIFGDSPLPEGVTSWKEHFSGCARFPDSAWKYGIAPMLDPARQYSELELWQSAQGEHPRFLRFASRERFEEMEEAGHAVVVFDLSCSVSLTGAATSRNGLSTCARSMRGTLARRWRASAFMSSTD
jgi:hypothetical protein